MKVILIKDVPHLGDAGTIQTVKDGYARNYLIPHGFATEATPGKIKEAEQRLGAAQRRLAKEEAAQQSLAERIDGTRLVIDARVGEQGRLYGSVTAQDIAERLSAVVGQEIDRRKVLLEEPIRHVGEHQVTVHLVGRLRPTVTVVVADEDGETAPAEMHEAAGEAVQGDDAPAV